MLNKRFLLISFIILSLMLTACDGIGAPKTVKVAVSLPLGLEYAQGMLNTVQLALNNADGKAGNVSVEILVLSESDPNGEIISAVLAKKNAEQAVKDTSVVALLGPLNSGQAKLSIPILNEASLTQISSTTTWPGLTKAGYGPGEPGIYYPTGRRTFFRTVPSDELQGAAAARWTAQLGYKTVYIVNGMGPYEQGVAGVFEITANDLGIQIIGNDTFPIEGSMITSELIKAIVADVITAKPDMVYLGGGVGSNGEVVALALREANATLPIMGPDGIVVDDLIKDLGVDLADKIYGTTIALPADKIGTTAADKFLKSYQAAYGKQPGAYDAATYEAMNVLLYAIGHARQPTREGVLESMQNLGDYSGIFGTWHFDEQGDISISSIGGSQVQNGAWTFVESLK